MLLLNQSSICQIELMIKTRTLRSLNKMMQSKRTDTDNQIQYLFSTRSWLIENPPKDLIGKRFKKKGKLEKSLKQLITSH